MYFNTVVKTLFYFLKFPLIFLEFIDNFIYQAKYLIRRRASLKKYQEVMDWVISQNLPPDTASGFELPRHLKNVDENGFVEALHTADGRYCILMKTQLGWRRNFKGTFYCNQPLFDKDFKQGFEGRKYICIEGDYEEGFSFKELYMDTYHNSYLYEVYFNLGFYYLLQ